MTMPAIPDGFVIAFRPVPCPHCGVEVPPSEFCGSCGSHLTARASHAARRLHSFAAYPEEHVLRLSIVSSLFPHLSHRRKVTFAIATAALVAALVGLAAGGAQAPLIGLASLGLPALFALYVVEVDHPSAPTLRGVTGATLVAGAGLGVLWGEVGGHYVDRALVPSLQSSLTSADGLVAAIVVPALAVVAMVLPVLIVRLRRGPLTESLDGFLVAAASAMGFVTSAALVQLSSLLRDGQLSQQPFSSVLTLAAIRGLTVPVTAAAVMGYVGLSLWATRRRTPPERAGWLTSPLVAFSLAAVFYIGVGFADIGNLSDDQLLVLHLLVMAVALVVLRVGLHHALLVEHHDAVEIGPPTVCGHCHRVVPAMPFCPHCGVARRATTKRHRIHHGGRAAVVPGPEAGEDAGAAAAPWPILAAGDVDERFATAHFRALPDELEGVAHLSHRWMVAILLLAFGVSSAALAVAVVTLEPGPPPPCHLVVNCNGPSAGSGTPIENGIRYINSQYGYSLRYPRGSGAQPSKDGISMGFGQSNSQYQGALEFAAVPANGMTASQVVAYVQGRIMANAQPVYVVPNPFVGYVPGAGEAYNYSVNGSGSAGGIGRLIILAAVKNNLAIVAIDSGPYDLWSSSNKQIMMFNDHPSPADQFAALVADPIINTVKWPTEANSGLSP